MLKSCFIPVNGRLTLVMILAMACGLAFFGRANAASVALTSPNGGECLQVVSAFTTTWQLGGADHADVYYSLTGLEADKQPLVHGISGQPGYTWIVPAADSTTVKLYMYGHDASHAVTGSDASDNAFGIQPSCAGWVAPPVISVVRAENVSTNAAEVRWTTDTASDSQVAYGTVANVYPFSSLARCDGGGNVTNHCVQLTGLTAGTTYVYRASSMDAGSMTTQSIQYQFTSVAATGSMITNVPPYAPLGLSGAYFPNGDTHVASPHMHFSWTDMSVNELDFKLYQRLEGLAWPSEPVASYAEGTVAASLAAPAAQGTYEYRIDACNFGGCAPSNIATIVMGVHSLFLRGKTLLGGIDGSGARAFISAWSAAGDYTETQSLFDGMYALPLAKGSLWHVAASRIDGTSVYRSSAIVVDPDSDSTDVNLVLVPAPEVAQAVTVTANPQIANTISLPGGITVEIPAGAVSSVGAISIRIAPDERMIAAAQVSVIGIAYTIEIRNADGQLIKTLSFPITLRLPYTDADVAAAGATPSDLSPAFYNEETSTWETLPMIGLDMDARIVSATVSHLSRFALIAPADTQPPDPPYAVTVRAVPGGHAIAWSNPTYDFHHIKIYRSTVKGDKGVLLADYLTGTAYTAALTGNDAYYTVRAVDLSGNESANTTQYSVLGPVTSPSPKELGPQAIPSFTSGEAAKTTGALERNKNIPSYQKYPNGTMLRIKGETQVWIVMNGFKRAIVKKEVTGFYAHLREAKVIEVSADELAQYKLAAWVRYVNSPKVYEVNGDATKHWLDMSADDFFATGRRWEAVFVINDAELALYATGPNVIAVK